MSDFVISMDPDDVILGGASASNLEHADDILLMSYSARGLQTQLNVVLLWCSMNFMCINAVKSFIAIFGTLPSTLPIFTLGDNMVDVVEKITYVGITFQTTHPNIFASHYCTKASKARVTAM